MGGGAQKAGDRVIGLLFGSQKGLDVSIFDAMEVACTAAGSSGLELNEDLVEKQKEICECGTSLTRSRRGDRMGRGGWIGILLQPREFRCCVDESESLCGMKRHISVAPSIRQYVRAPLL